MWAPDATSPATRRDMQALLELDQVSKHFPLRGRGLFGGRLGTVQAVSEASLAIARGETLALVGESGCGKTTLGRVAALLHRPTAGRLSLDGSDVAGLGRDALRRLRRKVQTVFQDPFGSLNPRLTAGFSLREPLDIHRVGTPSDRNARIAELIVAVGLRRDDLERYPHQFSGGQRQRIAIARALALDPALVVLDEPLSSLDVSVQSQVLNLLAEIKRRRGLAYLFISHDLAAVEHLADRIAVMYLGRVVELAPRDLLLRQPAHPYTRALIDAVPRIEDGRRRRAVLKGDVPSPIDPPKGCAFHPRCPRAEARCRVQRPVLAIPPGRAAAHLAACHFPLDPA
ncbi:MAG: ATP-binding cassette domain-containing protein [Alphaproteobacteria bacterium]|nr:ATP-binding cassette domain-containing protein [Alphaproteobacteria bacterium]